MKRIFLLLCILILVACEAFEEIPEDDSENFLPIVTTVSDSSEVVYTNGDIYTVNPDQAWAEAVAVRDGVIVAVGMESEVLESVGDSAEIIDLDNTMLMPGFHDLHLHAVEAGMNETVCYFEPFLDAEAYVDEIIACAEEEQPDSDWVRGAGVNVANLLEYDGFPIDLLDEAVPDRPVLILDDVGHGGWANTLAMEAVGFDQLDGNPPGGIVDRDPETGRLTGIVLENAQQPLRTAALAPTPANLQLAYDGLLTALDTLAENGITSVSDAGGYWTRGHHQVWQRAEEENMLSVRANNTLYLFPDKPFDEQMAGFRALFTTDPDSFVRFNHAKVYVDGIISQGTGLMIEPYDQVFGLPGVPDDGFPYFTTEILNRYTEELDAAGFQINYHVTGDMGARLALDAIEQAAVANGTSDRRHRLTHIYLAHPDDHSRFNALGVIADLQLAPSSIASDYIEHMRPLIGNRADQLLPAFDLHAQGATVTISSDWDADSLSPFVKISSILGQQGAPSLETIIEWMTINSAYAVHQEDVVGSIEVGKEADFVVLDRNIFDVSASQIEETQVLLTILAGEEVYRHANAP